MEKFSFSVFNIVCIIFLVSYLRHLCLTHGPKYFCPIFLVYKCYSCKFNTLDNDPLWGEFCMWYKLCIKVNFFAYGYLVFQHSLLETLPFAYWIVFVFQIPVVHIWVNILGLCCIPLIALCQYQLFWSLWLSWNQVVPIIQYFSFSKTVLDILYLLCFHINFRISLSASTNQKKNLLEFWSAFHWINKSIWRKSTGTKFSRSQTWWLLFLTYSFSSIFNFHK